MDKIKVGSNIYESKLPNGSVLFWSYNTVVAANLAKDGYVKTATNYSKTTTRQVNKWLSGLDHKTVTQKYLDSFKG